MTCPFTVVVDTREQSPYLFLGLTGGPRRRPLPLAVPTMRAGLPVGDYSILGYPQIVVERKSKEDLYGSVSRRSNFVGRLERMDELIYSAVVVEAEYLDCLGNPPRFAKLHPRSLSGTLIAWRQRYRGVDWYFVPGREAGERTTFRILERFWLDHRIDMTSVSEASTISEAVQS
jgi:ERCC4-type nuclease